MAFRGLTSLVLDMWDETQLEEDEHVYLVALRLAELTFSNPTVTRCYVSHCRKEATTMAAKVRAEDHLAKQFDIVLFDHDSCYGERTKEDSDNNQIKLNSALTKGKIGTLCNYRKAFLAFVKILHERARTKDVVYRTGLLGLQKVCTEGDSGAWIEKELFGGKIFSINGPTDVQAGLEFSYGKMSKKIPDPWIKDFVDRAMIKGASLSRKDYKIPKSGKRLYQLPKSKKRKRDSSPSSSNSSSEEKEEKEKRRVIKDPKLMGSCLRDGVLVKY